MPSRFLSARSRPKPWPNKRAILEPLVRARDEVADSMVYSTRRRKWIVSPNDAEMFGRGQKEVMQ